MQPYLLPYSGYFRLVSTSDIFVIYDDVQFSRSSWVTRNILTRSDGVKDWLTLPVKRPKLGTLIKDLEWQDNAQEVWIKNSRRFKAFERTRGTYPSIFLQFFVYYLHYSPLEFIVKSLRAACNALQIGKGPLPGIGPIEPNMIYSSTLGIPEGLKGQDRVLWVCKRLGATEYINAPGGTHLYDEGVFKQNGIQLKFLVDYPNKESILDRLCNEDHKELRREIDDYSLFQ